MQIDLSTLYPHPPHHKSRYTPEGFDAQKVIVGDLIEWSLTTEGLWLGYDYVTDASDRAKEFIDASERVMQSHAENPNGPSIREMIRQLEEEGVYGSTKYDQDDFLRIAREDLGKTVGFNYNEGE